METKRCASCEELKSVSEFRSNKAKKDGLQCYCIPCDKEKARIHYLNNKEKYKKKSKQTGIKNAEWWKEFKKTLKCNRCDESHCACLQFHHTDPSKKDAALSQVIRRWGKDRIMREIDKCEVLCANCHCKEHYKE